MSELLLKISGINKSFFGVQVLRDVGFELTQGAVLGLVGENGSGKSTTMNILGGVLTRDSGRVELAGEDVAPSNSRDALALGIAFIHQELSLFPNLSVEENIFLDHFPRRMNGLPFPQLRVQVEGTSGSLRLDPGYQLRVFSNGIASEIDVSPTMLPWSTPPWHGSQESVLRVQQHWVCCFREKREPETSGADSLKTYGLVFGAYESARTGDAFDLIKGQTPRGTSV